MMDFNKIVQGLTQSGVVSGLAGGLAGGALTGALTSKQGRKTATSLLKVGGIAAVGGLAWKAYQSYSDSQATDKPATASVTSASLTSGPARPQVEHALTARWQHSQQEDFAAAANGVSTGTGAHLIVRAMIAAAMADGHLDSGEHTRIFEAVDQLALTGQEKGLLLDELRHPSSLEDVVKDVRDPQTAVEVYAASVLAIDETRGEGRRYLAQLADRLQLPRALVESVHERAEDEKHAQAA